MTPAEAALMQKLGYDANSFDNYFDEADGAPIISETETSLPAQKGNPLFSAQFDLSFITKYYTLNAGVYTEIAAAALNTGLQNSLPFFIFGNSDFQAGFDKLKAQYPINANWSYGRPFIYGKDNPTELALDATVQGALQRGDLVIPFTSALPGAGTTTLALNIIRCNTVAYGTLLAALSSDRFILNGIRYVLDDTAQVAQFAQQMGLHDLSLFGKFKTDFVSPNSFKKPEQFQNGIVDIPLKDGIDKHKSLAFYNIYTNVSSSWSIYVWTVRKLSA